MPIQTPPQFAQFNQGVIVTWDDGSPFTGFLLVGIVLPTGYKQAFYAANYPNEPLPTYLKVPINEGYFHPAEGITYQTSLEPPNTEYICWYYDGTGRQIAGPSPRFTVNTGVCTPPALALPTPSAGMIPPVPNSGPSVTTNMPIYYNSGYFVVDYAPTLNLDLANALSQECVATGDVLLSTPIYTGSAIVPGTILTYKHTQDAVGGRTLTFGAIFEGTEGREPNLDADTYTQYVFQFNTSGFWQLIGWLSGLAA